MHPISTGAPSAHVFDPTTWLAQFERCGGYWHVIDSRISVGVFLNGNIEDEKRAGAALTALQNNPEQRAAVRAHLLASEGRG